MDFLVIELDSISRMGGRRLSKKETESLLKEAKIAVICSQNKDGTIHAVPVWFKYIQDNIVILMQGDSRKARNIKRDNRVTVVIDERGPVRGLMIYGKAEIDRRDPLPMAIEITEKYISSEKAKSFATSAVDEAGMNIIVKIKPEHIVSFHY